MSGRGSVALTPMHTAHIFICFLRWSLPLGGMSWTLFGQISLSWLTQFKFFISQNVRRSVWEDPEPKLFGSEWTSTSEHFCCHPQAILKLWFVKHLNISRLLQIFQPLPGVSNTFLWSILLVWVISVILRPEIFIENPMTPSRSANLNSHQVGKRARVNISKTKPGFSGRTRRSLQAEVSPGKQPRYAIAVASDTLH